MKQNRGFTFLEILIIVAIIAILIVILLPVFTSAREAGRQGSCLNNLENLGKAALMYANDNDSRFPPHHNQYGMKSGITPDPQPLIQSFAPYISDRHADIWFCPSDSLAKQGTPNSRVEYNGRGCPTCDHRYSSYVFFPKDASTSPFGTRLTNPTERQPSQIEMASDDTYTDAPCIEYDKQTGEWYLSFRPCLQVNPTGNHPTGANVLFYDGHVGFFPYAKKIAVFRASK